jgi:hypothetical protein
VTVLVEKRRAGSITRHIHPWYDPGAMFVCSGKLEDEPQIIGGVMITPRYNNENGCLKHDYISMARVDG